VAEASTGPLERPPAPATGAGAGAGASEGAPAEPVERLEPDDIRASRYLSGEGNYPPENAFDGTDNTGWAVRRAVSGEDYIEASFNVPVWVERVRFSTGYTRFSRRAGDLFLANDHLRRGRLLSDAGSVDFDVPEDTRHMEVELPGETRRVRLVILSVWSGQRWRDLTLTEIEIMGRPLRH
jgi:hypothetical protein